MMGEPALEALDPGILTTVQDRGRYGYQRGGVPVSGAMDEFALRTANLLVGNSSGQAGLEMTVVGPTLRFLLDTSIAVTGADMSAAIDGEPMPRWQAVSVAKGSVLAFDGLRDGMRAYLAISGGIDVPLVMGSRSTYIKSRIGGLEGRPLKNGDVIPALDADDHAGARSLPSGYSVPSYGSDHTIRLVLGPQRHAFTEEAIASFLSSVFSVSSESDRMGYRLEGPPVYHAGDADIVSDGNPLGAVQVPGDGIPRVLMADRGTTGGYTKIATVIGPDVGLLAQSMPGTTISFKAISIEEAHEVLREQEAVLVAIASGTPVTGALAARVNILVAGASFDVVGEDGTVLAQTQPVDDDALTESYQAHVIVDGESLDFEVDVRSS